MKSFKFKFFDSGLSARDHAADASTRSRIPMTQAESARLQLPSRRPSLLVRLQERPLHRMSFTETITSSSQSTLLLSPSKRRKLNGGVPYVSQQPSSLDNGLGPSQAHTPNEYYSWTVRQDSLAPCFLKDIIEMKDSDCS